MERESWLCHDQQEGTSLDTEQAPMRPQPMGEFMALHSANNGGVEQSSSTSSTSSGQAAAGDDPIEQSLLQIRASRQGSSHAVHEVEDSKRESDEEHVEPNAAPPKKTKKRVRYLRDTDRHNIIKRIENGEKQAALAREYGVTRAAICHIKKNREEIVTRYDLLVKQAKEMDRAENFTAPAGEDVMVREIRSSSVLLLMTTLRDRRSGPAAFRRAAGRLIMLLLEEALSVISARAVEMTTTTGYLTYGLERTDAFCGVAIGGEGFPFLVLFHQMEPEAPQGSIHVEMAVDRHGQQSWRLDHMDLPANISQNKVLLFSSTCSTGDAETKAIEALCSVGCTEDRIMLVVILAASDGVVKISELHPQVRIIAAAIDGEVDHRTHTIIPGLGDFVSRYNGA